ncbi:hypothetical protein J3R83DRAFT_1301 [Lanmaoa asiatica]|nr:hypothetical protein J3R83DRAFT_1301 [Lanmaoa asiatica]
MTAEARARIDEEITKLTLSLCDLRARKNTLSPIFSLPPETLQTIFIHLAGHGGTWSVPSWVGVSYVCRHWRDVALSCSTLWAYHFVASPRWTEELLSRSKQASLKIRIEWGTIQGYWWLSIVEKLMDHTERIQELHLKFSASERIWHEILSKLSLRAPRLQNLVISTHRSFDYYSESMPFNGDTPALRTLELSQCPVPWYSLNLSGLTRLSLHHVPVHFQQSMVELLAVLGCMQGLTHLHLDDALACAREFISSAAFNAFQKIKLPHLSRFLVIAPLSTIFNCQKHNSGWQCISEDDSEDDSSLDDYIQLSSLLAQEFGPSEDQALSILTIRSLRIVRSQYRTTFAFSALDRDCESYVSSSHVNWNHDTPLEIIVHLCDFRLRANVDPNKIDIYCTMLLSTVESVYVTHPPVSPSFWRKTLGHLPGLRYINLSYGEMPDLASVLSVSDREGVGNQGGRAASDRGPEPILVPALEELEFFCIICLPDTRRSLLDALSTRKATRGRLTMTRCYGDKFGLEFDVVCLWDGTRLHEVVKS